MKGEVNKLEGEKEREKIWEMLVRRDIEELIEKEW